jgi:hypothetical protein
MSAPPIRLEFRFDTSPLIAAFAGLTPAIRAMVRAAGVAELAALQARYLELAYRPFIAKPRRKPPRPYAHRQRWAGRRPKR